MTFPDRPSSLSLLLLIFCQQIGSSLGSKVQWNACKPGEFTTMTVQCATLQVPLDYSSSRDKNDNNAGKMIDLQLVQIPALVQPSRGSIQINFGGPGAPTREAAVAYGSLLQVYVLLHLLFACVGVAKKCCRTLRLVQMYGGSEV